MFEDFLNLTYLQIQHKLRKIRELINRISDVNLPNLFESLLKSVNRIDIAIQDIPEWLEDRRSRREKPIPPEENLPDLIIQSITPINFTNYVDFEIVVKNKGIASAGASTLAVIMPNIFNRNIPIPSLEANETFTVFTQYSFDPNKPDETKTVLAQADVFNVIEESDKTNNTLAIEVDVKGKYTPPAGKAYLIVHMHNPEGKEINSITEALIGGQGTAYWKTSGMPGFIATGKNLTTHGIPVEIDNPGVETQKTVECIFNGITLTQDITLSQGETKQIEFIFERETLTVPVREMTAYSNLAGSFSLSKGAGIGDETYQDLEDNIGSDDWFWINGIDVVGSRNHGGCDGTYVDVTAYNITKSGFTYNVNAQIVITGTYRFDQRSRIDFSGKYWDFSFNTKTSDFNLWFIHQNISGHYPGIRLRDTVGGGGDWELLDLELKDGKYKAKEGKYIRTFDTVYNFNKFRYIYTPSIVRMGEVQGFPPGWASGLRTYNQQETNFGTAQILIYSIPFDLFGTAI